MSKIKSIKAREIIDSRGNPTVEVDLLTEEGLFRAAVPSGASTGEHEAVELRDGGKRFHGKGVQGAVKNINEIIAPKIAGKNPANQKEIDELMIALDGTKNKSNLGANALLGVSFALCKAASGKEPLWKYIAKLAGNSSPKLPKAAFNIINGGAHAGNDLDVQEFMIVPQSARFSENFLMASEIYQELKSIIQKKYSRTAINIGDEGGFAPPLKSAEDALELVGEAARNLGYEKDVKIILDVASTQFYKDGKYEMKIGSFEQDQLADYYINLVQKYPIAGIEDPFAEDDWPGWTAFVEKAKNIFVVGDDLTVTNSERIKEAEEKKACNAMILKPNQIGTLTEAMQAGKDAQSFGWKVIVSHRSGDTNDDFIADLAVGLGADFIKSGAPARGERLAKYNRLLRIEEEMEK